VPRQTVPRNLVAHGPKQLRSGSPVPRQPGGRHVKPEPPNSDPPDEPGDKPPGQAGRKAFGTPSPTRGSEDPLNPPDKPKGCVRSRTGSDAERPAHHLTMAYLITRRVS